MTRPQQLLARFVENIVLCLLALAPDEATVKAADVLLLHALLPGKR